MLYILLRKSDNYGIELFIGWEIIICLLVISSWIKIDIPDKINCDKWIRPCMLENNWQGFSSMYTNSEAIYQLWSIKKQKGLKQWYNNILDDKITYLIIMNLLNINEIISKMIHLTTNHCCRYVDATLLSILSRMQSWWYQIMTYCADWYIKLNKCLYYCKIDWNFLLIWLMQYLLIDEYISCRQ